MNKKGFSLIELIISLFLLSIFIILLTSSIKLTSTISKGFLDFSDYEYAMMHKKILEIYNEAEKVDVKGDTIIFENENIDKNHKITINNKKIYKSTKNPGKEKARGYSLLLDNMNNAFVEVIERDSIKFVDVNIVDRSNKKRRLILKLKDDKKEKEDKDKNLDEDNNKENNS